MTGGRSGPARGRNTERAEQDLAERFRDLELLSSRGPTAVFAATEIALDRRVAVKALGSARSSGDHNDDGAPLEVLAQARLSWHPNVLTLHEFHRADSGVAYVTLELAEGGSLQDVVDAGRPISRDELIRLGTELSAALAATHEASVIHCDVKPSNVLLAGDGSARLADFGISRLADITLDTLETLQGSLRYVPPELLDGAPPTPANDVYALALTLHAAAAGHDPFGPHGQTQPAIIARIHGDRVRFADLPGLVGLVDDELIEVLDAALGADPAARPTAEQLHHEFARAGAAAGSIVTVPLRLGSGDASSAGGADATSGRRSSARTIAAVLVALALIGGVATAIALRDDGDTGDDGSKASPTSPTEQYCAALAESVDARVKLFDETTAIVGNDGDAVGIVEQLLVTYPVDFREALRPLLTASATFRDRDDASVADDQIEELALTDSYRSLVGKTPVLLERQSAGVVPRDIPTSLRAPAQQIAEVFADSRRRCPDVTADLDPAEYRMSTAISLRFVDPNFLADFFNDPASQHLLSARAVNLMVSTARVFIDVIVGAQSQWFVGMLDARAEVRRAVTFDHPDIVLAALKADPTQVAVVDTDDWRRDMSAGLLQLDPPARAGIEQLYGAELTAIHLELPTGP